MAHNSAKSESTGPTRRATRERHVPDVTTIAALETRKNGGSLRSLARALDYANNYAPTLGDVLRGEAGIITRVAENDLRLRLGLPPIVVLEVPPCPDCGDVHTGRCHGRPVVEVVTLAPGEVVTPARQPARKRTRPPGHRPYIADEAKWRAYQEWSRQWDAQEDPQP